MGDFVGYDDWTKLDLLTYGEIECYITSNPNVGVLRLTEDPGKRVLQTITEQMGNEGIAGIVIDASDVSPLAVFPYLINMPFQSEAVLRVFYAGHAPAALVESLPKGTRHETRAKVLQNIHNVCSDLERAVVRMNKFLPI